MAGACRDAGARAGSREEIELTPTGAIARHGQHRVVFSSNASDPNGAVDMVVNHQVRLRSSLLALRYFNPVDGRSVVLATVQDAQGELLPPNQIIYRNVFDNVAANLVITVRLSGTELDLGDYSGVVRRLTQIRADMRIERKNWLPRICVHLRPSADDLNSYGPCTAVHPAGA